jgi:hypothetical protein
MDYTEIRVQGVIRKVPSVEINGTTVMVTGKWLKVAGIKDEDLHEGEVMPAVSQLLAKIQQFESPWADVFTFCQKLTDPTPRFPFPYEWDSVAAIPVNSYSDWWTNRVSTDLRNDVRKAAKRGLVIRPVSFTDDFVRGIKEIYDETPVRQGRPFWHYQKDLETIKLDTATYLERSEFLGAFIGEELVGFLKLVYVDRIARLMQIISKDSHRDKRPLNALIAKAVQLCETKGCSHLTYGKFRYSRQVNSLTNFKHRNGFEEILVPKYYVLLTAKGRLAFHLRLHRGARALMPEAIRQSLRRFRASIYQRSLQTRNTA